MATVDKNFRIKHGLVVEGSTGTINGNSILTENSSDQYIINLIGGQATSANTPNAVVKRDGNGSFAANEITANSIVLNGTDLGTTLNNLDSDAQGYADAAESNANSYTDSAISTEVTNRNNAIATAKSEAISTSESYTDSEIATEVTNRNSAIATAKSEAISTASSDATTKANAAESNANDYTDTAITNLNLAGTYDALGAANNAYNNALADANDYTDGKVSDLVNSAPALLDTLGELASALQNNPDVIQNIQNVAAGKQDTLTAGEGIYIDQDNVITGRQQSGGGLKFVWNEAAIDRSTVDAWYDASGAAATAQSNAESYADNAAEQAFYSAQSYADGLASNYDAAGAASAAQTAAQSYADTAASNAQSAAQSYADTAASNAQSAAESYTDTAVGSLDTSVVPELPGATNKYFTDQRALDATAQAYDTAGAASAAQSAAESYTDNAIQNGNSNATPTYAGINLDWVSKLIAGYASGSGTLVPVQWSSNYGTAKFTVHVRDGVHSQASEILIARDSSNNIHMTEYAIVTTNGILADVSAVYDAGSMKVTVTPTNGHTSVECAVSGSAVVWAD